MRQYYVVMPDGSKFGPGTLDILNTWIQEGRLLPTNTIEVAVTGELLLAKDLQGLQWTPFQGGGPLPTSPQPGGIYTTAYGQGPQLYGGQQPYGSPQSYGRQQPMTPSQLSQMTDDPGYGDKDAKTSMAMSLVSLCLCPCVAFYALWLGYTARSKGSSLASSAIAFAWLVTIISCVEIFVLMIGMGSVGR